MVIKHLAQLLHSQAPPTIRGSVRPKAPPASSRVLLLSCESDPTLMGQRLRPRDGRQAPLISAHCGGNTLAPENTPDAYAAAFVPAPISSSGRSEKRRTGTSRRQPDATQDHRRDRRHRQPHVSEGARALNVARQARAYDPSRIATVAMRYRRWRRCRPARYQDRRPAHGRIAALVAAC
jgi:hypothetical protein